MTPERSLSPTVEIDVSPFNCQLFCSWGLNHPTPEKKNIVFSRHKNKQNKQEQKGIKFKIPLTGSV